MLYDIRISQMMLFFQAEVKAAASVPVTPVSTKVGFAFATDPAAETLQTEVAAQLQAHGVQNHVTYVVRNFAVQ